MNLKGEANMSEEERIKEIRARRENGRRYAMRMIESEKVVPLFRLLLMNQPKDLADAICEDLQAVVDIHTVNATPIVRCEDCTYKDVCHKQIRQRQINANHDGFDLSLTHKITFCSYGINREEDNE